MYDSVISLIKIQKDTNKYGDLVETKPIRRQVMAEVMSIGQSEFYQAQAAGLKPEIKFKIADYLDYEGEEVLEYTDRGKTEEYKVIRTYRKGIELEITCKRGID